MNATADTPAAEAPPGNAPGECADGGGGQPLQAQLAGVLGSMRQVVDLQIGIWLARVKTAVLRIVVFAALALMSLVLAFGAMVWGYSGLYRILTDILHIQRAWALLIFAGAHLLLAGILGFTAVAILRGPKSSRRTPGAAP